MMSRLYSESLRERLKQASWVELATRARQEVTKRWDYARYRLGTRFDTLSFRAQPPTQPGKFFFSSDAIPGICGELRRRFPERVKEIQASAEQICDHRLNLLGYEELNYGPRIDWHADLVHSKRAPMAPWFKIHYLNFAEVGDSKITWELNRHQHLVTLAKAYLLTQESRYAEELFRLWYDWRKQNPYPIGINWASSLEVAFRSLSWIWIHHLLQSTTVMPQSFPNDLTVALALHGRHIETYLSTYFSPNTHLLGEAVALFFLGTLYSGMRNADRWKTKGWEIIQQEAMRQVQDDGMHFEQSVHYHVYALDFFLHARILAGLNQVPVSAEFDKTIVKMLEALCTLGQAGTLPHLGDDDGGRVFDPARNRVEHLRDPLSTGAILFERGDFKAAGTLCEETLWLLGKEGTDRFDSLAATACKARPALTASGIYVMADCARSQQLVLDAGSLGTGRAGHGHADALSLNVSMGGREFLTDPGTFSYVSADIDRNRLRGTRAHNTLQIDGLDQAEPDGPFAWRRLPRVNVETWQNGQTFDLLVANQSAHQETPKAGSHQRTIFYLKSRFWFVRDVVTGAGERQLDLFWHFQPGIGILQTMAPGSFVIHGLAEDQCLALLAPEDQDSQNRIEEDYWSPSYGKVMSSLTLRISQNGALPSEFATMLIPLSGRAADCGRLRRMNFENNKPTLRGYTYNAPGESHCFFFNDLGLEWSAGIWSSNARFVYCATSSTGELLAWIISRGSFLAIDRRRLLAENEAVEWSEWRSSSGMTTPGRERRPATPGEETVDEADKVVLRTIVADANKAGDR